MRERIPAERGEVEDETLWRDAGLLRGRPDGGKTLGDSAAEKLGYPASVAECPALHQAEEVQIAAEEPSQAPTYDSTASSGDRAVVAMVGIITLHRESAGANEGTVAYSLAAIKDWTFLFGPGWVVGWGNGLILG